MKNFLTAMSASDHIAGYFAAFRKGFSEVMDEEMREDRSQPQEVSVTAFERDKLAWFTANHSCCPNISYFLFSSIVYSMYSPEPKDKV